MLHKKRHVTQNRNNIQIETLHKRKRRYTKKKNKMLHKKQEIKNAWRGIGPYRPIKCYHHSRCLVQERLCDPSFTSSENSSTSLKEKYVSYPSSNGATMPLVKLSHHHLNIEMSQIGYFTFVSHLYFFFCVHWLHQSCLTNIQTVHVEIHNQFPGPPAYTRHYRHCHLGFCGVLGCGGRVHP